ncbi:MAG TPA: hypothetical protein VJQ86_12010 [Rhodanobacteraceae bacterium]|nr:hypothetical protein [Rhodanobacteraceae bacterium]
MQTTTRSKAWSCLARVVALGAGTLALAGCATGYSFVQPDAGGAGSYYTSDSLYPAPAYYYDGGVWAYDPYGAGFGYGNLYGPSLTLGLGFGSVCGWSCGGYYGGWPWYYGGTGYYRWRRHHGHHHHDDPVTSASPRPWLNPDHPRVPPPGGMRGTTPPTALPERPMEGLADRRPLGSASFAPHGIDRMMQPTGIPDRPAYPGAQPPVFVGRPMTTRMPASRDFGRPAAPAFAPARAAPPPARSGHTTPVRIP